MTKEEKIIATAFTGTMFIDGSDMGLLYEYMEKKVGHGVIDLMLADKGFWEELHRACEQDFIDMISKEQPSLPSNLDEAAEEFEKHAMEDYDEICVNEDGSESPVLNCDLKDAFKAGAEWMAEQGVYAYCIQSYNPVSESPDEKPHCITLKYEENENTPYIHTGDRVKVILRKI